MLVFLRQGTRKHIRMYPFNGVSKTRGSGEEKLILFDVNLKPEPIKNVPLKKTNQPELIRMWTQGYKNKNPRGRMLKQEKENLNMKTFALGSRDEVCYESDVGFLAAVLCAYNNHWLLKTSPEDWWIAITQKVAMTIDEKANDPSVKQFFVSHEGKKQLTVKVDPSIYNVDYEWFFNEMKDLISTNINNSDYTDIMDCNFPHSTSVQKIVNNIMLMKGFKEYFEYRMRTRCGVPGVRMVGTQDDWKLLPQKFYKLKEFLEPIQNVLGLHDWFNSVFVVLDKLLDTYQGNPDKDWWSKMIYRNTKYGSGGTDDYGGWFISDFLGLGEWIDTNLTKVPSGLSVVPLTLTDGVIEEATDLVAGVTGYKVTDDTVYDAEVGGRYPTVQSVQGWGLFLNPDSIFR